MFVAGTSTRHPWEKSLKRGSGVAKSASTISRLNQSLTQQLEAWRKLRLQEHWRILYLDGIHFEVRHGDQTDSTIILTADGEWTWTARRRCSRGSACAEEDKEGWGSRLQDLRARGATHFDLFVTDGHDGVRASMKDLFPTTPRQRWQVA